MSTERPLVSAIIPAYNSAAFLARAIRSALAQDYPNKEVIVVDDGSTDNTEEVATSFGDRITYLWQQNAGPDAARNLGIRKSSAAFIALLDSDDEWLPGRLSKCLQPMIDDNSVGLTYCLSIARYPDGREEIYGWRTPSDPLHRSVILQPPTQSTAATSCRRSVVERAGYFGEHLVAYEDHDLWIRMRECANAAFIDEPLVRVHARPDSLSTLTEREKVLESYSQVVQDALERRPDLYESKRGVISANLHYLWGMYYYYSGMHRRARHEFIQSFRHKPFFETFVRIIETIPPSGLMSALRRLKCRLYD